VFIFCFNAIGWVESGSDGSGRVQTGRVGYGFRQVGSNQFDLLEEIGSGRVNLYVDFFRFKIDFDWIVSYLISDWAGSG
jgi:hypothetical protein